MFPVLTVVMLAAAAAFFVFTMYGRLAPLLALRRERRTDRVRERISLLLRYGFGQKRLVDRGERGPGLMHVVIFAAFLVLVIRTITLFGIGFDADFHLPLLGPESSLGRAYGLVKDVVVVAALLACVGFAAWRVLWRPERVTRSSEALVILGLIAGLMATELLYDGGMRVVAGGPLHFEPLEPAASATGLFLAALGTTPAAAHPIASVSLFLHLAIILVFGNLLPYGKHFHVITGLPNVFFARLPPAAALAPLDLEKDDARFGTATVKDLSWKEAWDVYSCTLCGRCLTHCPTHVTGKPLAHKEVNRALRHHLAEQGPSLVAIARAKDPAAKEAAAAKLPAITAVVAPETAWACTTCGWCETACPVLIENIPRLVDMRRQQVMVDAVFPDEAVRVFNGIERQGNPWGLGASKRTEWCADLDLPRASSGAPYEWLFFVGCAGAFDDRQKKVSRAIVQLLRHAGVSFAILGEEETCTGDAARRLGNEFLFQTQAKALVDLFASRGVRKILVQCPHCLNTLKNELPQFGGRYEVVHHAELLARLAAEGKLRLAAPNGDGAAVAFHDPCYLARWNGITEAPREALRAAGAAPRELPRNRREGFCCGAGGGRMWLEEKLGTRINQNRVAEAAETLGEKGGVVATACPFCLTMLKDGVNELGHEERLRVMDVAELVALRLPRAG